MVTLTCISFQDNSELAFQASNGLQLRFARIENEIMENAKAARSRLTKLENEITELKLIPNQSK